MQEFKPDTIVSQANDKLKALNALKKTCENNLKYAPTGFVRVQKYRSDYQYYLRTGPKDFCGKYIRKKDMPIAHSIIQRDYYSDLLKEIDAEIAALEHLINSYHPEKAISVYSDLAEGRRRFITPAISSDSDYIKQFLSQKYAPLGFSENDSEYYTFFGLRVRSKSEIHIAEALHRHNIPFLFEYPLYLRGLGIVYPDFYCLNVRLRKIIIWEHLGMLDSENYATRNTNKTEKYILNNYIPGDNLILTFETLNHPLNIQVVEKLIETNLL